MTLNSNDISKHIGTVISVLVAIVAVVSTFTFVKSTADNNTRDIASNAAAISSLDNRLRGVELSSNRQSAEFAALKETLNEIKEQQRENNTMLRQLIQNIANK